APLTRQHAVVGDVFASHRAPRPVAGAAARPARPRDAHAVRRILHQAVAQGARVQPYRAFHHRHVAAVHVARRELSLGPLLGRYLLGEDPQARSLAVEPVDDVRPTVLALRGEVIPEDAIG